MAKMTNSIAIVTGGGSGIGREICKQFAEAGCEAVAVLDIDFARAQETVDIIGVSGTKCFAYEVDVASLEDVTVTINKFRSDAGSSANVLVNNVGWSIHELFVDNDPSYWRRCVDVNLTAVFNTCHVVLKDMIELGGGRIVNVASDAGRLGAGHEAVYSAAKGGVITFTKALAREMARHNILVNTVSPGSTNTNGYRLSRDTRDDPDKFEEKMIRQTPLRRLGEPEEVARMVTFLASEDGSFVLGQTISVSGGLTMVG